MSTTEAVFIVGVSRSGTTLMRRILNASSQVAICAENHFLGHLIGSEGVRTRLRRLGDLRDDATVDAVVEFIYGGGLASSSRLRDLSRQWLWTRRRVPREEFRRRLLESDRSERAVFEVLMRAYADHFGKPIMGEKTPAHVRYVDTALEWFPNGRVIHMLRDPRAVYVSELRRRRIEPGALPYRLLRRLPIIFPGFVLLQSTLAWLESVVLLRRWSSRYPDRYLVVRFEDLVSDHRQEVGRACDFLGIELEEPMLEQVVVSHGRRLGAAGFDREAAERWRGELGPLARAWFGLWFGGHLRRLGYAR